MKLRSPSNDYKSNTSTSSSGRKRLSDGAQAIRNGPRRLAIFSFFLSVRDIDTAVVDSTPPMERAVSSAGWLAAALLLIFQFATRASAMTAHFHAVTFAGTDGAASTFVQTTKCCTLPVPCTTATCSATVPLNSTASLAR